MRQLQHVIDWPHHYLGINASDWLLLVTNKVENVHLLVAERFAFMVCFPGKDFYC